MSDHLSFGMTSKPKQAVWFPSSPQQLIDQIKSIEGPFLGYGKGRSYGDSCLVGEEGVLIDTCFLNAILSFDPAKGLITCESGVSLSYILDLIVPKGLFLPVLPGTSEVTVGGAIANNIHGKNHHHSGSFCDHVEHFRLLRSDGIIHECYPGDLLFQATCGGLGLTGVILDATIKLIPASCYLDETVVKFNGLEEFFTLDASYGSASYSVAWLDCLNGPESIRGHYIFAEHSGEMPAGADQLKNHSKLRPYLRVPFSMPDQLLQPLFVKLFNQVYYSRFQGKKNQRKVFYRNFFFPLDSVSDWNLIYGQRGFYQYQCLLGLSEKTALLALLQEMKRSCDASFLAVLKRFGENKRPSLLSFPKEGYTIAIDFPNRKERTKALFSKLDRIVEDHGGRLYPAKDALMSSAFFQKTYPSLQLFENIKDPKFSSLFWERIKKV